MLTPPIQELAFTWWVGVEPLVAAFGPQSSSYNRMQGWELEWGGVAWGGGHNIKTLKRHKQGSHFHDKIKENLDYCIFPKHISCFGYFPGNHWF